LLSEGNTTASANYDFAFSAHILTEQHIAFTSEKHQKRSLFQAFEVPRQDSREAWYTRSLDHDFPPSQSLSAIVLVPQEKRT
jgi:hypothetical protein